MEALTLLIADHDEDFRHALVLALQDSFYIRTCSTGAQALALLRRSAAHILVVDLMLPEIDGLTLLETLTREHICPEVLVLSPDIPPEARERIAQLDISSVLRKPCSLCAAVEHIRLLRLEVVSQNMYPRRVRRILQQLHLPLRLDGGRFLQHCLPALAQDPSLTITKHLYTDIAKTFDCSTKQAEHSIRNAIEVTWKAHRCDWECYFPNYTNRPSNGDFLRTIAQAVRNNLE